MSSLCLSIFVFMVTTVRFFHSVSQDIVFEKSSNNAVQILLSGGIQSWNVLHPVLLLFLSFCEWCPPPSQCTQWVVCESLFYLTSDLRSC